jgi:N-formylmaleamate deformylase
VLAHGLTDHGLCWARVAQGLEPEYDVVMYDARGHGQSSAPTASDPPLATVLDLIELVRALGLVRPHLIGHSMGAVTVALAAALEQTLFRSAVLVDPPLLPDPGGGQGNVDPPVGDDGWERWRATVIEQRQLSREELVAICRARSPGWSEVEQQAWADAHRRVHPAVFDARHPMHGPWQRELAKIDCPLLLIAGETQFGSMVDAEAATGLARHTKRGRLLTVPGAGHSVHRDRYEQFMLVVREFLAAA